MNNYEPRFIESPPTTNRAILAQELTKRYQILNSLELQTDSPETQIFSHLFKPVTEIAISQLTTHPNTDGQIPCWADFNPQAANNLATACSELLQNQDYQQFFSNNPTFVDGLKLLKTLSTTKLTEAELRALSANYEARCLEAHDLGKAFLFISYITYYSPEDLSSWDAYVDLVKPADPEIQKKFDHAENYFYQQHPGYDQQRLNRLTIDVVGVAGHEINSPTSGQALEPQEGKPGYYLALNILDKKNQKDWHKIQEILGLDPKNNQRLETLIAYYVFHEIGHTFWSHPKSTFAELMTDIPATLSLLNYFPENIDNTIGVILTDLTHEIRDDVHTNSDKTLASHHYSSTFIVNQLFEHQVISFTDSSHLVVNQQNIDSFTQRLQAIHSQIMSQPDAQPDELSKDFLPSENTKKLCRLLSSD